MCCQIQSAYTTRNMEYAFRPDAFDFLLPFLNALALVLSDSPTDTIRFLQHDTAHPPLFLLFLQQRLQISAHPLPKSMRHLLFAGQLKNQSYPDIRRQMHKIHAAVRYLLLTPPFFHSRHKVLPSIHFEAVQAWHPAHFPFSAHYPSHAHFFHAFAKAHPSRALAPACCEASVFPDEFLF